MGPIDRKEIINDMTYADKGPGDFLNLTCDIGDPPSRAPVFRCQRQPASFSSAFMLYGTPCLVCVGGGGGWVEMGAPFSDWRHVQ